MLVVAGGRMSYGGEDCRIRGGDLREEFDVGEERRKTTRRKKAERSLGRPRKRKPSSERARNGGSTVSTAHEMAGARARRGGARRWYRGRVAGWDAVVVSGRGWWWMY